MADLICQPIVQVSSSSIWISVWTIVCSTIQLIVVTCWHFIILLTEKYKLLSLLFKWPTITEKKKLRLQWREQILNINSYSQSLHIYDQAGHEISEIIKYCLRNELKCLIRALDNRIRNFSPLLDHTRDQKEKSSIMKPHLRWGFPT